MGVGDWWCGWRVFGHFSYYYGLRILSVPWGPLADDPAWLNGAFPDGSHGRARSPAAPPIAAPLDVSPRRRPRKRFGRPGAR